MSEELRPCPFCGKIPKRSRHCLSPFDSGPAPRVAICECGAYLNDRRWQNRPIEDALRAELEQVKAENARLRAIISTAAGAIRGMYDEVPETREGWIQLMRIVLVELEAGVNDDNSNGDIS